MHRAYYGALENGKKNLQLSPLERVCEGLGVTMSEIIQEAERIWRRPQTPEHRKFRRSLARNWGRA